MPHETRYFIEYRVCGKLRMELISIQNELLRKFPNFHQFDDQIPHITLVPPINQGIAKEFILESIREELKSTGIEEFKVKNFGFFDNDDAKPIFVKIRFSENFKRIRDRLMTRLRKKVKIIDRYENEGFNPHIALGFTKERKDAEEIVGLLNKHPIEMRQIFDRISILNGNRILWEYDMFNKKTLSRAEALKNKKRLAIIHKIIDSKNKRVN
jgi:2'-5' RNA ligase